MNVHSPDSVIAASTAKPKRHWNWWKIGFFVSLIAFEAAREVAVVESQSAAEPAVLASVYQVGDLVTAEGRWRRIDHKDDLMPNTVHIQCLRNEGKCTEAATNSLIGRSFGSPEINTLDAVFTPEAVTYSNDYPCVTYSVRIDLKLEKVFAVRDGKKDHFQGMCKDLEPRIEMRLGNGFEDGDLERQPKHFVPLLDMLVVVLKAF